MLKMIKNISIIDAEASVLSKDLKQSLSEFFPSCNVDLYSLNWSNFKNNPIKLIKTYISLLYKISKNDLVIVYSPLIVYLPILLFNRSLKICLYFDFFPIHQIKIKKIKKCKKILFIIEKYLFTRKIYSIGLMSNRNISFAKQYFSPKKNRLFESPLWSTKKAQRKPLIETDKNKVLKIFFGGQLIDGRNLDFLKSFMEFSIFKEKKIEFHVFGAGKYESVFMNLSEKFENIKFRGKFDYKEFINEIKGFDIGLICTDINTSIPSYPSKSLDILSLGIPLLGVSEESSDFSTIINSSMSGEIINMNDNELLWSKLELIRNDYNTYSNNAIDFYNKRHFYINSLKTLKQIIYEIK